MGSISEKNEVKVTDPVRHPNVQLPMETDMKIRYKRMSGAMVKMLTVALTHSLLK